MKMFKDSLRLILSKTFAKTESRQEDRRITMLGAKKRVKHSREEIMEKLVDLEAELDEAGDNVSKHGTNNQHRETISTKEEALLPSQEVGDTGEDDDLILGRMMLRVQRNMNKKLTSELADAKVSAQSYLEDIEKERNARKVVENICADLKKKLTVNMNQLECMKLEVERTKIGSQIRENALEMKLEDARLMLEKKYDELDYLQGQLEAFVRKNRSNCAPKMEAINEAEILLEEIYMAKQSGV